MPYRRITLLLFRIWRLAMVNHKGENNPFFGHSHKEESKKKISDSQKLRYEKIYEIAGFADEEKLKERIKSIVYEELQKVGILHRH